MVMMTMMMMMAVHRATKMAAMIAYTDLGAAEQVVQSQECKDLLQSFVAERSGLRSFDLPPGHVEHSAQFVELVEQGLSTLPRRPAFHELDDVVIGQAANPIRVAHMQMLFWNGCRGSYSALEITPVGSAFHSRLDRLDKLSHIALGVQHFA